MSFLTQGSSEGAASHPRPPAKGAGAAERASRPATALRQGRAHHGHAEDVERVGAVRGQSAFHAPAPHQRHVAALGEQDDEEEDAEDLQGAAGLTSDGETVHEQRRLQTATGGSRGRR